MSTLAPISLSTPILGLQFFKLYLISKVKNYTLQFSKLQSSKFMIYLLIAFKNLGS
jgi:hypothetical protein